MAAQDLGDMQAEILEVKHAIRSDTPRPVHGGCEAAANRGKEVPGERQRPTNPHAHTHTGTQYRPRVGVATSRPAQVPHTAISHLGTSTPVHAYLDQKKLQEVVQSETRRLRASER